LLALFINLANSVAPGIFPTEMTTEGSNEENKSHIPVEGYREKKNIPAGRPGKDEDMAQAILMLAVNNYCNGQTISIDGGYLLGECSRTIRALPCLSLI
jgi:NAD(P)-dependent dehydrogenase (short-subunit alcohol dehydrogenase family)